MRSALRPDAIDTRIVFWVYAVLAGLTGFVLAGWGQMWLGDDLAGERWAKAALVRAVGSILVGVACAAAAMAMVEDPPSRRRGLAWFAAGHGIVCLMLFLQLRGPWGPGLGEQAPNVLFVMAFVFVWLWFTEGSEPDRPFQPLISLFSGRTHSTAEQLRSEYELQIRQAASQEERNRLARELHDSIKQQIFVIQTAAATVEARFEQDETGAKEALGLVRNSARDAMAEMEAMLDQLRAATLGNAGLVEAIKKQCEALGFRTGAEVEFQHGKLPPDGAMAVGAREAIFRVAQEALSNIARHARATKVSVFLTAGGGRLDLMIRDNGAGFDLEKRPRGMGIGNMVIRAEEVSGVFDVNSAPGAGTKITFSVPYRTVTPRTYRRRAWIGGVSMVLLILLALKGWGLALHLKGWTLYFALVGFGIMFARDLVAYRRTRKETAE